MTTALQIDRTAVHVEGLPDDGLRRVMLHDIGARCLAEHLAQGRIFEQALDLRRQIVGIVRAAP